MVFNFCLQKMESKNLVSATEVKYLMDLSFLLCFLNIKKDEEFGVQMEHIEPWNSLKCSKYLKAQVSRSNRRKKILLDSNWNSRCDKMSRLEACAKFRPVCLILEIKRPKKWQQWTKRPTLARRLIFFSNKSWKSVRARLKLSMRWIWFLSQRFFRNRENPSNSWRNSELGTKTLS